MVCEEARLWASFDTGASWAELRRRRNPLQGILRTFGLVQRQSDESRPARASPTRGCADRFGRRDRGCDDAGRSRTPASPDPMCPSMGELDDRTGFHDQVFERHRPAVPVRAFRLRRDRRDEMLAKRLPVTVEACPDDRSTQAEHTRLPRGLEDKFAVPTRRGRGTSGLSARRRPSARRVGRSRSAPGAAGPLPPASSG